MYIADLLKELGLTDIQTTTVVDAVSKVDATIPKMNLDILVVGSIPADVEIEVLDDRVTMPDVLENLGLSPQQQNSIMDALFRDLTRTTEQVLDPPPYFNSLAEKAIMSTRAKSASRRKKKLSAAAQSSSSRSPH